MINADGPLTYFVEFLSKWCVVMVCGRVSVAVHVANVRLKNEILGTILFSVLAVTGATRTSRQFAGTRCCRGCWESNSFGARQRTARL